MTDNNGRYALQDDRIDRLVKDCDRVDGVHKDLYAQINEMQKTLAKVLVVVSILGAIGATALGMVGKVMVDGVSMSKAK